MIESIKKAHISFKGKLTLITKTFLLGLFVSTLFSSTASAKELREYYYAKLGHHDHYSSKGVRLTTIAAILRQDRANFHKFHKRDQYDTYDKFFDSKSNRAAFERMMRHTNVTSRTRDEILYGTPKIKVKIYYGNHIEVEVY